MSTPHEPTPRPDDQAGPTSPPPASYPPPPSSSAPYAAAPAYDSSRGYGGPPPVERPGRTLGIVAFVLAFFVQLLALILGIVALVQSRKAGQKNGFALWAIIISVVVMVISAIVLIFLGNFLVELVQICSENGPGVYEVGGRTFTCG